MLTENDSSQPAMRVKRRGEKSLAGLIAAPAFRPKLEIYKLIFYQFRPNERFLLHFSSFQITARFNMCRQTGNRPACGNENFCPT